MDAILFEKVANTRGGGIRNKVPTPQYRDISRSPLTDEDIETLRQSIEEGKIPIKFDSPFEPDEHEKE